MYFDFEDYRPDISPVGRAISWREGVLISVVLHLAAALALALSPEWLPARVPVTEASVVPEPEPPEDRPRFVFVQPRIDTPAPRPPVRPEVSDMDRLARAPEVAPDPLNEFPLSRGNSPERAEDAEAADTPASAEATEPAPVDTVASLAPPAVRLPPSDPGAGARTRPSASLGDALRNLQRYIEDERFDNPRGGGGTFGPAIQFDTMGVEFGPWIRRFVAQVRANWEPLIPLAAWSFKGHVVITFNVHRNGAITDLTVVKPASIEAFNTAAYGALASSNPTVPLPSEYPAPRAFFTVTFFYNENPEQ
jgi:outer membrane biosynthesis protein TonB